jgi:hypothetical protein
VLNLTGNMTMDFELEKRPTTSTCSTTGIVMAAPLAALVLGASTGKARLRKRPQKPAG